MSSDDQLTDGEEYATEIADESVAKIFKNGRDISGDLFSMSNDDQVTVEEEDYEAVINEDSVTKIFENAKDIEKLCQSLPDMPIDRDPDHEIEKR